MNYERAQEWVKRISEYFGKGYDGEILNDMVAWIRNYAEPDLPRIYAQLKAEVKKSFKVDIKTLSDAARQLGIFRCPTGEDLSGLMRGERIACDACGADYQYNRYAAAFEITGATCSCPICGWYHRWTEEWIYAGRPGAQDLEGEFTIGPYYHKRVTEWATDLEQRKQYYLQAKLTDQRADRKLQKVS